MVLSNIHGYRDTLSIPLAAVLWFLTILTITVYYLVILYLSMLISKRFTRFFVYSPVVGIVAMTITTFLCNFYFSLMSGERQLINLSPNEAGDDGQRQRLSDIMGKDFIENSVPIDATREMFAMRGYASLPTLNRSQATMQSLFVNGRAVKDRTLLGAVRGAYSDFLMRQRMGEEG